MRASGVRRDLLENLLEEGGEDDGIEAEEEYHVWSLLLRISLVGFFVHCQPSEPFLTKYLEDTKGLTEQQLDDYVWPYDTYGSLIFLLPAGLLADRAGYRTVIFLGLLCREATRLLLLYGEGVTQMAVMQVAYAGATSVNSVYYAYVYTVVNEGDFTLATSVVVAAVHAGSTVGSLLCQVLDSTTAIEHHIVDYFYISWACTSIGLLCFVLAFPAPRRAQPQGILLVVQENGCSTICDTMKEAFTSQDSAVWSMWWICGGVCAPYIIANLYQTQFQNRWQDGPVCLPAFFMEVMSICGAMLPVKLVCQGHSVVICSVLCAMLAALYWIPTYNSSAWASYICNTLAVAIYNSQYSFASASIARSSSNQRYAIVFTVYQFLALSMATVVSSVGSSSNLHTDGYYSTATFIEAILALAVCIIGGWINLRNSPKQDGAEQEDKMDVRLDHEGSTAVF